MRRYDARVSRVAGLGVVFLGGLLLANCTQNGTRISSRVDPKYGVSPSPRVVAPGQPVPKGGGVYLVGKPYVVAGRTYYPAENKHYRRVGTASWYGEDFHGRLTANGEIYDMDAISAAHPTLPLPSYARVTNLRNGRSLIVRVNDRGPFHDGREIDLSRKAAELLQFARRGTTPVKVEYVGPASLDGSDDRKLMATLREGGPAPVSRSLLASGPAPDAPRRVARADLPALAERPSRTPNEDSTLHRAPPMPTFPSRTEGMHFASKTRESPHAPEDTGSPGARAFGRSDRTVTTSAEPLPPPRAVADAGARDVVDPPAEGRRALGRDRPSAVHTLDHRTAEAAQRRYALMDPPSRDTEAGRWPAPARLPSETGTPPAQAGRRNVPRLVWQVGPAPARIESNASYVVPDEPPSADRAVNGRGLY